MELAATAPENCEECIQYLLERGADYHEAYTGNQDHNKQLHLNMLEGIVECSLHICI